MQKVQLDAYVTDVLMPDLVGHDHRPAAFILYLFLLRQAGRGRRDGVAMSLQTMAMRTGLSKSTVQAALRHLQRRGLLDAPLSPGGSRRVRRPWA
jgi:DNA-binding MarR family transcriptional regulator